MTLANLFALDSPDVLIILAIVLLLFGGTKLPQLARSLGAAKREFHEGAAGGELDDATHAAAVVVASGQETGAGGGAQRRRVKVAVAEPTGRQAIERRRRDVRPVATELRVADIVEEDHDDVRRTLGSRGDRRPPGRGVLKSPIGDSPK